MNNTVVHCLFERSGTFKNEFINLGFKALDYDISNEFNCTDICTDLFSEIGKAFNYYPSVFDDIQENDIVIAFFPCTRFENQIGMSFRGVQNGIDQWSNLSKLYYVINLHNDLNYYYNSFCKLCVLALRKNFRLIIENPYSKEHYLNRYFPIKSSIIDRDRSCNGDKFFKPTQYWFINCIPYDNVDDLVSYLPDKKIKVSLIPSSERSFISSEYAKRFIKSYVIPPNYNGGAE